MAEAVELVCIAFVVLAAVAGAAPVVEDILVAGGGSIALSLVATEGLFSLVVLPGTTGCAIDVVLCIFDGVDAADSKDEACANKLPVSAVAALGTAVHRANPLIEVSENPAGRFGLDDMLKRNGK